MKWIIYDDAGDGSLLPFTWLRPASDLLLGARTGLERLEHAARSRAHVVCRDYLAPMSPGRLTWRQAAVFEGTEKDAPSGESLWSGSAVWISSRVIADRSLLDSLADLDMDSMAVSGGRPIAFRPAGRMASWVRDHTDVGSGAGNRPEDCETPPAASVPHAVCGPAGDLEMMPADPCTGILRELLRGDWPARDVSARVVGGLADLVRFQERLLEDDLRLLLEELPPAESAGDGHACKLEDVRLGEGCVVDCGAVLDAREGPVVLGPGCHVFPHTWLRGPLYAGENCFFLGGRVGTGTSLGPVCRVRGEVEATVMLGYCNKAHDGFIGHSYLGEWINLGAMTTNSDLKNNYSVFRIEPYGRVESTGLNKVGALLADHVKTRIGCLLGGGTTVGVGSNLVGDPAVASRWVPDFLWGSGSGAAEYEIERFLETARVVYGRRQVPWTSSAENALRMVHEATRAAREAYMRLCG